MGIVVQFYFLLLAWIECGRARVESGVSGSKSTAATFQSTICQSLNSFHGDCQASYLFHNLSANRGGSDRSCLVLNERNQVAGSGVVGSPLYCVFPLFERVDTRRQFSQEIDHARKKMQ
jgi:hypothetical protein